MGLFRFFGLLMILCAGSLFAAINNNYNLTDEWNEVNNPSGVWSYQQGVNALPRQSGICCIVGAVGAWAPGSQSNNFAPAILKAVAGTGNPNDYLAGDVIVYTADNVNGNATNGDAVIAWIAPASGPITFTGAVWYANSLVFRSNDYLLQRNYSETLASGTVSFANGRHRNNPSQFIGTLYVNAGDVISLRISRSSAQIQGALSGVRLNISQATGYQPFQRDFRGIGRSDVFLYDPANGNSYAGLSAANGTFSYVYAPYTTGFPTLRTGDFDGNARSDMVLYNPGTTLGYIGFGQGNGLFTYKSLFWGSGFDRVEPGDLNADGRTDFILYRTFDGTMYSAIGDGTGNFTYTYMLVTAGYNHVKVADFNGDGKSDLFLYRSADGFAYYGIGVGDGQFTFAPVGIGASFDSVETGDINNDGKADLILYSRAGGATNFAFSNGLGFFVSYVAYSPGFTAVRFTDLNGDGKADLFFYNANNGLGYFGIGSGDGNFTFGSLFWGLGMDVVMPQDLNGDGNGDVVLYNTTTGTAYAGIGNGAGGFTYTYSYWGPNKLLAR